MAAPFTVPNRTEEEASLSATFGRAGRIGEIGEAAHLTRLTTFSAGVAAQFPPHRYEIVHSLDIPRGKGELRKMKGDVDIAIASGDHVVLLDVKKWKSGFYISLPMPPKELIQLLGKRKHSPAAQWLYKHVLGQYFAVRGLAPHVDGNWKMSKNMEIAVERYRERLSPAGVKVTAMVVFERPPSQEGPFSVRWLRWPGRIRSYLHPDSFSEIYDRLGAPAPVDPATTALFRETKRRG